MYMQNTTETINEEAVQQQKVDELNEYNRDYYRAKKEVRLRVQQYYMFEH